MLNLERNEVHGQFWKPKKELILDYKTWVRVIEDTPVSFRIETTIPDQSYLVLSFGYNSHSDTDMVIFYANGASSIVYDAWSTGFAEP